MILTINPGATSTKISIFVGNDETASKELSHSVEELAPFATVGDQYEFRRDKITEFLSEEGIAVSDLTAIACRGGASRPVEGGVYEMTQTFFDDLRDSPLQHPANLAGMIGFDLANQVGIKAYVVDSEVANELQALATYSGNKSIKRKARGHFLNQKAMARDYADELGKSYNDLNLIVCHMGGGNSVGAHCSGRIVDMTDAVNEGPFSTDRSGALPIREVIDLCFTGDKSHSDMKVFVQGQGGLISYLGTNDMREAEGLAEKDDVAKEVLNAYVYQISKDIGAMAAVLKGKVDAIILTGGIANSKFVCAGITEHVGSIAEVVRKPGEMESGALAIGVQRVLNGGDEVKVYPY